ncbi:MAG: DUF4062 domain-containing protein [Deinococcus-Thermus bacterium]|jgi:hypothetical protein|nr:DUF4062 domain-containing protein [Deinococcota bacterium]
MTTQPRYDVFISAVSNEFEAARDLVASRRKARGLRVRIQPEFPQGATTTLAKLYDFIRDCDAVVAVIGRRSGAFPTADEAAPYAHMLAPLGLDRASYTQWEVIFALHYGKHPWVHVAAPGYAPEKEPGDGDDPDAQERFRNALFGRLGLDRTEGFTSPDGLRAEVMEHDWPDHSRAKSVSPQFSSIGSLFKGRDAFLEELRARLGGAAPLDPSGPVQAAAIVDKTVVHGLGGVGKTRAAIEYGLKQAADHTALLFLTAESPESLETNLAALTGAAHLDLGLDEAETAVRVKAVLDWLAKNPGWFLVVDNADTKEAAGAVDAVLGRLRGGKVLITSRYANWGPKVRALQIDVIAPEAAVAYLMEAADRRAVTATDEADAAALAERLGWLSLALAQAAAYIRRFRISFATYSETWETRRAQVNAHFDKLALDYPLSVATTWATTFAALSPCARTLLGLLAQLSVEPIPRSLLAALPDEVMEADDAEDALAELADYSLATFAEDGESFTVHRVVQEVTRDEQAVTGQAGAALGAALRGLSAAIRNTNPQDVHSWPVLDPLQPHALAAPARGTDNHESDARAHLLNEFGMLLHMKAQHARAEPPEHVNEFETVWVVN